MGGMHVGQADFAAGVVHKKVGVCVCVYVFLLHGVACRVCPREKVAAAAIEPKFV